MRSELFKRKIRCGFIQPTAILILTYREVTHILLRMRRFFSINTLPMMRMRTEKSRKRRKVKLGWIELGCV